MTTLHTFSDIPRHIFKQEERQYRRPRNLPRLHAIPEPNSGFRSPFDPDRMHNPLQRGRHKPSEMHTSAFRSLDPNFGRIVNNRPKKTPTMFLTKSATTIKPKTTKAHKPIAVIEGIDPFDIVFDEIELDLASA